MKGKSLLAALIALGIFSGSAYAAPSFKQSGNKFLPLTKVPMTPPCRL